jgi:hypothetical protein
LNGDTPTLGSVKKDLKKLREVAAEIYAEHPSPHGSEEEGWTLERYLMGIDELDSEITEAMKLPADSPERIKREKRARNVLANALYFRGRLDLKSGRLGVFRKKCGERNVHWAPTELSRQADRLANEPLRQIYKETEALIESKNEGART